MIKSFAEIEESYETSVSNPRTLTTGSTTVSINNNKMYFDLNVLGILFILLLIFLIVLIMITFRLIKKKMRRHLTDDFWYKNISRFPNITVNQTPNSKRIIKSTSSTEYYDLNNTIYEKSNSLPNLRTVFDV